MACGVPRKRRDGSCTSSRTRGWCTWIAPMVESWQSFAGASSCSRANSLGKSACWQTSERKIKARSILWTARHPLSGCLPAGNRRVGLWMPSIICFSMKMKVVRTLAARQLYLHVDRIFLTSRFDRVGQSRDERGIVPGATANTAVIRGHHLAHTDERRGSAWQTLVMAIVPSAPRCPKGAFPR